MLREANEPGRANGAAAAGGTILRRTHGSVPEWPKGADCKSAGNAFGGSNPPRPTTSFRSGSWSPVRPRSGRRLRWLPRTWTRPARVSYRACKTTHALTKRIRSIALAAAAVEAGPATRPSPRARRRSADRARSTSSSARPATSAPRFQAQARPRRRCGVPRRHGPGTAECYKYSQVGAPGHAADSIAVHRMSARRGDWRGLRSVTGHRSTGRCHPGGDGLEPSGSLRSCRPTRIRRHPDGPPDPADPAAGDATAAVASRRRRASG